MPDGSCSTERIDSLTNIRFLAYEWLEILILLIKLRRFKFKINLRDCKFICFLHFLIYLVTLLDNFGQES